MTETFSDEAVDPRFAKLLNRHDRLLLGSNVVCAYGLWHDFTLAYLSPGYFQFAAANGGEPEISQRWGLGSNVLDAVDRPLRQFFHQGYQRSLDERRPWEHCYECSSAERFRWLHMITYPLEDAQGLLAIHSLRVSRPHRADHARQPANPQWYVDPAGLFHQCSYCRRMRRNDRPEVWEWVEAWVRKSPEATSHGICEACYGFYEAQVDSGLSLPQPIRTVDRSQHLPA